MYKKCKKCGKSDYIPDCMKVNHVFEGLCLDCIAKMIEERRNKIASS